MALTTQERTSMLKLVVVMFNAALGGPYLQSLTTAFEGNGRDLSKLARDLSGSDAFQSVYPQKQTAEGFAASLLIPLGLQGNSVAFEFVVAKFNAGVNKGQIIYEAMLALNNTTDAAFDSAKALLNNKAAVSDYYSVPKPTASTDLPTLKALLNTVTVDPFSVVLATTGPVVVDSPAPTPMTFTLTAGLDNFKGAAGDDTFTATTTTLQTTDVLDGAGGKDTLNYTNTSAAAFPVATLSSIEVINVGGNSNLQSSDLSTLTSLTNFNASGATVSVTTTNARSGVEYGLLGDNVRLFGNSVNFGYQKDATQATLNLQNGVKSNAGTNVFLTGSSVTTTVINSTGAANALSVNSTAGVIVTPSSSTSITINATTNLTAAISSTNDTKLTVTGPGVVDLRGVNYGFSLNKNITTIDASAQTAGGTLVQAGNPSNATTLKFVGGAGNDSVGLGVVLATGAQLDGAGGTDTIRTNNATFISAVTGAFIKNFEIVDVAANITVDLDHLAANNTLTGLRLGGASNVVNNVSAAAASNVTVYATGSPNLNLKGATSVGQSDTVTIETNDGFSVVSTISLGAPGLTGVETLNVKATDNVIISGLNNSTQLTAINFSGAGTVTVISGAVAVNAGMTVDASAATGNFTFNGTGATGNGYTLKGSSGANKLAGGNAPISVDITKSTGVSDSVSITSATGSTSSIFQTISGFTNSHTVNDVLDLISTPSIPLDAVAAATGVTNLSGAISSGIITFSGSAAGTATLQNKIDAAAALAGATQYRAVAFQHGGNTFVYQQGDTTATYAPGVDLIVQLTGVTGVTALSTIGVGGTTIAIT